MKILSVHFSHDSNIAYVNNGTVLATVNEDRFTRKKKQTGWPNFAIKWLFEKYKLNFHDFDTLLVVNKYVISSFSQILGFLHELKLRPSQKVDSSQAKHRFQHEFRDQNFIDFIDFAHF